MKESKQAVPIKSNAQYVIVSHDEAGRRIDNFLMTQWKGIPKSRVYRLLRKGEVRVNARRIQACYRLNVGDKVRLPPIFLTLPKKSATPSHGALARLANCVLYEDDNLMVVNKPSGISVHGGSTVRVSLIEALHHLYPHFPQLELAHRLDSGTSGCLILAKKKRILRELHELLRQGHVTKLYWTLTKGIWRPKELEVDVPLQKDYQYGKQHMVTVSDQGKVALTRFRPLREFKTASLMEATLSTGRTHQIRVHAQYRRHPVAMDDRYGDPVFNQSLKQLGLARIFLHAHRVDFVLPSTQQQITVKAPLDAALEAVLQALKQREPL
jgi:23S rRNA pseudouridine955/2504/2580 synthase